MSDIEDLTRRVAALEARLDLEAGLRASVDRDLSALDSRVRAMHHIVQAVAITQSEHTETLGRHTDALAAAHGKLDHIITMLDRLGGGA